MQLKLDAIVKRSGAETHLYRLDLSLQPGAVNVLLGATLSGKTSLLRIAAGLDQPSEGSVWADDRDVTGIGVRHRNLAMVYQQFINYPSLSVFENIASPLRLQRRSPEAIKRRVGELAELLRLSPFLDRLPAELSGGQQQRTALARALAKDAALLLLDEPLVNLDYKLREELRAELGQLFRSGRTTVVYATTEPQEALQLGGHTALLHCGKVIQFGATYEVFKRPGSLLAAQAFSDPPLNLFDPGTFGAQPDSRAHALAARAHHLSLARTHDDDPAIRGRVELAEISGSETFLHVAHAGRSVVALLPGVHPYAIGTELDLYVDRRQLMQFDSLGNRFEAA